MDASTVLSNRIGLIVAPAGCGKTQLIVETLKQPTTKPILVLTHTTAGVAALQSRLINSNVPRSNYHLATIAGWAISLVLKYPTISGINRTFLTKPNYPQLHTAASQLIAHRHIDRIIEATYSRILVDEYQDCSFSQHNLITQLSRILPTTVLGDPMQSIFGFDQKDPLPCWESVVQSQFPLIGHLNTPWRWTNVNRDDLGSWVLSTRNILASGQGIDITHGGPNVSWIKLSGNHQQDFDTQVKYQYELRKSVPDDETILIIGHPISYKSRHKFAQMTNGIGVVESVEMKDVTAIFTWIDKFSGDKILEKALDTATDVMTGLGKSTLLKRVETIMAGRGKKIPTTIEITAAAVKNDPCPANIYTLFNELALSDQTKVFRHAALKVITEALLLCSTTDLTAIDSVIRVLEKRRHSGDKRVPNRAIGSTLLLKGLEADHVIILDGNCDKMDSKNLYVALSRGAKSITVFAKSPILGNV